MQEGIKRPHELVHTNSLTNRFTLNRAVLEQDRSVYCEDWGEGLTSKSVPVICVVDLHSGDVTALRGVPADVSPGQVRAMN